MPFENCGKSRNPFININLHVCSCVVLLCVSTHSTVFFRWRLANHWNILTDHFRSQPGKSLQFLKFCVFFFIFFWWMFQFTMFDAVRRGITAFWNWSPVGYIIKSQSSLLDFSTKKTISVKSLISMESKLYLSIYYIWTRIFDSFTCVERVCSTAAPIFFLFRVLSVRCVVLCCDLIPFSKLYKITLIV